ncbi:MAG: hypothetical protein R3A13_03820 [Bdellovibrionota bacterium]
MCWQEVEAKGKRFSGLGEKKKQKFSCCLSSLTAAGSSIASRKKVYNIALHRLHHVFVYD